MSRIFYFLYSSADDMKMYQQTGDIINIFLFLSKQAIGLISKKI